MKNHRCLKVLSEIQNIQGDGGTIQEILTACQELVEDYADVTGDNEMNLKMVNMRLKRAIMLLDLEEEEMGGEL